MTAGWISISAFEGSLAVESISVQIGQRAPVFASITTTGDSFSAYWPMWLIGGPPIARTSAAVSMPGIFSRIVEPWLKPLDSL